MRFALPILVFLLFPLLTAGDEVADRPNVILFLVDDLGWKDIGCQGSDYYRTPNINALATSGVRFTNAYAACAVCSPTRAAILTGKYPARLLLTQWLPAGRWSPEKHQMQEGRFLRSLPLEEITLAETLRESGYLTWHVGKWHLGGAPFSLPQHHGFNINIAGDDHGAPGSFFHPFEGTWKLPTTAEAVFKRAYTGGEKGDFLTDCLTDEAIQLIESRGKAKPFFLYFPYYAVHTPLQGKPELMKHYQAVPEEKRQGKVAYAAMIESVDESVGRIMEALRNEGLDENTLVIFTSDNGGFAGATDNRPLRANKGSHYEGGIRVPLLFSGAGVTDRGSVVDIPATSTDLYATILEVAGLPSKPHQHLDGISLAPVLTGGNAPMRESIFWHYPHYNRHPQSAPVSIIRQGKWKLIEFLESGEFALYDLVSNPEETVNLTEKNPERFAELKQSLAQWKSEVRADPMTPNPILQP